MNKNNNKNMDNHIIKIISKTINKKIFKKPKNKNKRKNKNKKKNKNTKKKLKSISKSLNTNTILHNHKENIPKRIRELVWTTNNGETYVNKCFVTWCDNNINVFNFQVGHDIPESKGGTLEIDNLKPICSNCNLSMGNKYTITEWCKLVK